MSPATRFVDLELTLQYIYIYHMFCPGGTSCRRPGARFCVAQARPDSVRGCLDSVPDSRVLDLSVPCGEALQVGGWAFTSSISRVLIIVIVNRYGSVKSAHRRTGKIKGIERILGTVDQLQESLIEVTSGQAKYEHHHRAIVWRCPRLPKEGQGTETD